MAICKFIILIVNLIFKYKFILSGCDLFYLIPVKFQVYFLQFNIKNKQNKI